jgi:glycosyltransferase involved in cell wall biosynthesis
MGKHHLPDANLYISFLQTAKLCRKKLSNGKHRIFQARRVDEMIQALLLKYLFGAKIKIVFSSAAQRHRSGFTLWLTQRMDAVLAMCKASDSYLAEPADKVNYHGINTEHYAPPKDKASVWQSIDFSGKPAKVGKYGIAMLGRVRKQKGTHLFVEACIDVLPRYPDYTAVVVGAISSSNEAFVKTLQDKIQAAGLAERIVFTGEQKFSDIPKIFSSLSLVAALSENEGFGLTILEAMSSGAAVLATQAGAWQEVIREEVDGCVVPVNDLDAVKNKLDYLLSDNARLIQMGVNGRERILENFTVEREAKDLCEFFKQLQ